MRTFKPILILLILIVPGRNYASNPKDTTKYMSCDNSIGLSFAPAYYVMHNNPYPGIIQNSISFSTAISYKLKLNSAATLYLFSNAGFLQNNSLIKNIPNTSLLINSQGNINYRDITYFNEVNSYDYVFINENLAFTFCHLSKRKDNYLFAEGGLECTWNFKDIIVLKNFQEPPGSSIPLRKATSVNESNLAWILGVGCSVSVSERFTINIIPEFLYAFSKIQDNSNYSPLLFYDTGINFQVLYNF